MRFENPMMLWLMAGTLPVCALFFWWSWKTRKKLIHQFVQSRLIPQLTVGVSFFRQKIKILLVFAAIAFLFIALARPQWGYTEEEVKHRGLDILVAIDTSRSMLASDLAPNRLSRAKLAALDLMKAAETDRLGLIAFSGGAFLQCPLTFDEEVFRQSVNILDVNIIPQGGTAITEAIDAAIDAFKTEGDNFKILILFTDGEDHVEGALEAAERAAEEGMRIFAIGVGTPAGELLRQTNAEGEEEYIKDEDGNVVKSSLNEQLLLQLATTTQGAYLPLRGAQTIEKLYELSLAPLPKSDIASRMSRRYYERYHWPLGIAIALLLCEMFIPERRRPEAGNR